MNTVVNAAVFDTAWHASEEAPRAEGVATFYINQVAYTMHLPSFEQFQQIQTIIEHAYWYGRRLAFKEARIKFESLLRQLDHASH